MSPKETLLIFSLLVLIFVCSFGATTRTGNNLIQNFKCVLNFQQSSPQSSVIDSFTKCIKEHESGLLDGLLPSSD